MGHNDAINNKQSSFREACKLFVPSGSFKDSKPKISSATKAAHKTMPHTLNWESSWASEWKAEKLASAGDLLQPKSFGVCAKLIAGPELTPSSLPSKPFLSQNKAITYTPGKD